MRIRYLAPAAVALVLALPFAAAHADTGFTATCTGAQEVPPNGSTATGTGTFVLNNAMTQLSFNITHNVVNENNAHIHGPAAPGVSASPVFQLALGSPKVGVWNIDAVNLQRLLDGLLYVNIHSVAFGGGEIRGQIVENATPTTAKTWGRIKALYR